MGLAFTSRSTMLKQCALTIVIHAALANICCIPRQWEGIEAQTTGFLKPGKTVPMVIETEIKVHFDALHKRQAFDETVTVDGHTSRVKVIQLWTKGMEYIILESGKCTKKSLTGHFPEGCIPDTAKDLGTHFKGSGSTKLNFHTYEVKAPGLTFKVDMTLDCEPLTQEGFGKLPNGDYMLQSNRYYDIVHGIKDTSVFDVPSSCDTAAVVGHVAPTGKMFGK